MVRYVEVQGVGRFGVRPRSIGASLDVTREYNAITGGADAVSDEFDAIASVFAYLRVMVVERPAGWEPEEGDPDDPEAWSRVMRVYEALRADEARFRGNASRKRQEEGAGAVADGGVVVPGQVPAAGD